MRSARLGEPVVTDHGGGSDACGGELAATAGQELAREIRRHRYLAGLSQADLAAAIGYSRQYMSLSERPRKGVPSLELVRALDEALHADGTLLALRTRAIAEHHGRRPRRSATGNRYDAETHEVASGESNDPAVERQAQAVPQSRVLLPVLVDGRQVLLPLDTATVAGRDLETSAAASPMPLPTGSDAPSCGTARASAAERAYELYLRGQGLLATNDKRHIEAASTLLDRALDIDPQFARARAARGYARWRQYFAGWGFTDTPTLAAALDDVEAVLHRDPGSIGARTTLVRICWDLGWHERALGVGRAVYENNPHSLDATLAFARALNNSGMAAAALPLTLSVLQVDPSNPTALKLIIWNHLMVNDYVAALAAGRLYLPSSLRDSNTRWAVAMAHLGCASFDDAVRTAEDAVTADPDDVTAWSIYGYLLRLTGHVDAARSVWERGIAHIVSRAATVNQLNMRTQAWLASLEACVGRVEQAHEKIARVSAAEPRNAYLKYRLAHVQAELGDTGDAIRTLAEAVQGGFLSAQLLRHEERLGLSSLVRSDEYHRVVQTLNENVEILKSKYTVSSVNSAE